MRYDENIDRHTAFNLFASYPDGMKTTVDNLASAYENFALLLAELPQDEDRMRQLRRLNYTRIELAFMQSALKEPTESRHVLYGVFMGKHWRCWMRR